MSTPIGGRMPLLEHLREFRRRLILSCVAILAVSFVGWFYYNPIISALARPVCDLSLAQQQGTSHCGALYINGILGPLNLQIKVALLVGVIISAPFWLFQMWAFIAPGLHRKEKRNSIFFLLSATPFFAAGAYLGYLILPVAVKVLIGFTPSSLSNLVRFDDYLDFVLRVILLFGLAFELPVFLVALNLVGFISGRAILKPWRMWIFGIVLFTAAFTPTGDPLTMCLLALPLCAFYLMAGCIALLVDRKRLKKTLTA